VFGFSLPPSDTFFRFLYALGTTSKTRLRRFWVFDPDQSGAVEGRFRALLGQSATERFRYVSKTFRLAVNEVAGKFDLK
jgi:hypothetical protein